MVKVTVHTRWTCDDGCCADSNTVTLEFDHEPTKAEICEALEVNDWVYSFYREQYLEKVHYYDGWDWEYDEQRYAQEEERDLEDE